MLRLESNGSRRPALSIRGAPSLREAFGVELEQPLKRRSCIQISKRIGVAGQPQRCTGCQPRFAQSSPVSFQGVSRLESHRPVEKLISGGTRTTQIGYVNRNNQRCSGHRGVVGNDHEQRAYKMECLEPQCGHVYGANGTDVFQRKCPRCQGGAAGILF